ncbi:pleckstrin homology domain-containing family A member 8 [Chrysoperla carnea]|uniref:pleckstrin homology domain-containing family A member 8 n=1 Tax=Chrysoperla carnea TaxID=189513 RepID=UPI001D070EFE|nr:pleckstrin homology domain-containing family A member 8 [Chrysoperla carnea]
MTSCEDATETNSETLNSIIRVPFPHTNLESIDTLTFLEAARGVVDLIEKFGKVFKPVKYDMNGNIEKLNRKYQEDPINHTCLQTMILHERDQGKDVATDALMWLRRALQFFHKFIECLIEDSQKEEKSENLSKLLKVAYADTLQRYHGWMAQRLFNLLSRMCPARTQIFNVINHQNIEESILLEDMTAFNDKLNKCLQELVNFYDVNGLENQAAV